jgi:hypothetical protein
MEEKTNGLKDAQSGCGLKTKQARLSASAQAARAEADISVTQPKWLR